MSFESFEEFWPFYLSEHRNPVCRALHFAGTSLALLLLAIGLTLCPYCIPLAPFAGYGFAWPAHFFFEKNRPATFKHPLWSLRGDFRMYRLMWLRRLGPEMERAREKLSRAPIPIGQ